MVIVVLVAWILLGLALAVIVGRGIRIADLRAERQQIVVPEDVEVPTAA